MGLQIVCVERSGKKADHRHITAVGVDTPQVIIRFSVKTVRKILKRRTMEFTCLDPDGNQVTVRRFRCTCGAKTLRTQPDDITDGVLSALPTCSRLARRNAGPAAVDGPPIAAIGLVVSDDGQPRSSATGPDVR